jgi:DNA invertase Pin-like site-specific DNA recombinase
MNNSLNEYLEKNKIDKSLLRVVCYRRFSSLKQAKGSSLARQHESAKAWCEENGVKLDESVKFEDKGKSAFSGKNAESGKLAAILAMVASGEIASGTVLLVEAFDRLTRMDIQQGMALMMSLINAGVMIVTLIDDCLWNRETLRDLPKFMMSVMHLYRGHEESKTKSDRLQNTFRLHREKGTTQAFGTAPGWLHRESKLHPWQVDKEKAAVVRRVFELSAAGLGSKAIAAIAREEKWPVPMRLNRTQGRWHAQMAGRILNNRAVVGEHQHRISTYEARAQYWRGLEVGEPIKNYYPPIISDELWLAARASIRTRSVAKRRDAHYFNVWSGLLYCGCCGAPIQRKNETTGHSRAQLTCADRLVGATQCRTMAASNFDATILQAIYEHDHESFAGEAARRHGDELGALEVEINDKRKQIDRIADAIASGGGLKPFVHKAQRLETEAAELKRRWTQLKEDDAVRDEGILDETFVEESMSYLYVSHDEEAREKRAHLNLRLLRVVETIWVFGYDCAFIKFKNSDEIKAVPLPAKRLPSRAKVQVARDTWVEPPKPVWDNHFANGIALPEPRKPKPAGWQPSAVTPALFAAE